MELTILADKLPHMSVEQYEHEFRVVHANETKKMAHSLGILLQYVQGLVLTSAGQEKIRNPPIPEPQEPLQSVARLTWPALEVMQGSFSTQGYRDSAGKHIFATVLKIFLTERLEPNMEQIRKGNPVRLLSFLVPADPLESNFRRSWDNHAIFCRSICSNYQRNQVLRLEPERIVKIFNGTQFPEASVVRYGGYEEFVFEGNADAQAFFDRYGEQIGSSYEGFITKESFCVGFDTVVQYDDTDRGYQQIITGTILGMILRAKLFLEG